MFEIAVGVFITGGVFTVLVVLPAHGATRIWTLAVALLLATAVATLWGGSFVAVFMAASREKKRRMATVAASRVVARARAVVCGKERQPTGSVGADSPSRIAWMALALGAVAAYAWSRRSST